MIHSFYLHCVSVKNVLTVVGVIRLTRQTNGQTNALPTKGVAAKEAESELEGVGNLSNGR